MPKKKQSKQSKRVKREEEFKVSGAKLVEKVKELIHEGNVRRIIIQNETGKTIVEIPVTVAAVGTVIAPLLAALGVIAALVSKCRIVVKRKA